MNQNFFNGGKNGGGQPFPQENEPNTIKSQINSQRSTALPPVSQRSKPSNVPVNRGTTHIFYKTRMCQKFFEGNCPNGSGCNFAHGPDDLREPPPNWQELVKDNRGGNGSGRDWNDDQKIIQRMRICRKFYNGDECPYGDNCNFLHENPAKFRAEAPMDMPKTREISVINIPTLVDRRQTHIAHGLTEHNTPVRRVEGDGQTQGHPFALVAGNHVNGAITEPLSSGLETAAHVQQGKPKGFLKLAKKKVNRIYGDWINEDDE